VLVGESIIKTQPLGRKIEELLGKNRR
jgi:hypothetical protein